MRDRFFVQTPETRALGAGCKLGNTPAARYLKPGRHLGQRIQNEVTLHYPGMRQRKLRPLEPLGAEYQQIQVDAARPPAHARRLTPQAGFERTQCAEECADRLLRESPATALTKSGCAAGPSGFEP
jgi:hypothetical protein